MFLFMPGSFFAKKGGSFLTVILPEVLEMEVYLMRFA
jgi:hypothetical protein